MGLFDFFKRKVSKVITPQNTSKRANSRLLKKEDFQIVGMQYYEQNIKKLAVSNSEWKTTCKTIEKNGNIGKKIFRYNYINKPVKLIPEPTNKADKNAVQVIIAGELVGYIPATQAVYVKNILSKHEVKYITAHINGGDYKVVSKNGDIFKDSYTISINVRIAYV